MKYTLYNPMTGKYYRYKDILNKLTGYQLSDMFSERSKLKDQFESRKWLFEDVPFIITKNKNTADGYIQKYLISETNKMIKTYEGEVIFKNLSNVLDNIEEYIVVKEIDDNQDKEVKVNYAYASAYTALRVEKIDGGRSCANCGLIMSKQRGTTHIGLSSNKCEISICYLCAEILFKQFQGIKKPKAYGELKKNIMMKTLADNEKI